jgi:hypothetical protein
VDDDELRASKRTVAMRWYEWTVSGQNQPFAMIGEWRASDWSHASMVSTHLGYSS